MQSQKIAAAQPRSPAIIQSCSSAGIQPATDQDRVSAAAGAGGSNQVAVRVGGGGGELEKLASQFDLSGLCL